MSVPDGGLPVPGVGDSAPERWLSGSGYPEELAFKNKYERHGVLDSLFPDFRSPEAGTFTGKDWSIRSRDHAASEVKSLDGAGLKNKYEKYGILDRMMTGVNILDDPVPQDIDANVTSSERYYSEDDTADDVSRKPSGDRLQYSDYGVSGNDLPDNVPMIDDTCKQNKLSENGTFAGKTLFDKLPKGELTHDNFSDDISSGKDLVNDSIHDIEDAHGTPSVNGGSTPDTLNDSVISQTGTNDTLSATFASDLDSLNDKAPDEPDTPETISDADASGGASLYKWLMKGSIPGYRDRDPDGIGQEIRPPQERAAMRGAFGTGSRGGGPAGAPDAMTGSSGDHVILAGPAGVRNTSTGPAGDRDASTGPAGARDASTGPAGDRDASTGPAGARDASTGPAGDRDASTGPAGGRDASTGPAGGRDASTGPAGGDRDASTGSSGDRDASTGPGVDLDGHTEDSENPDAWHGDVGDRDASPWPAGGRDILPGTAGNRDIFTGPAEDRDSRDGVAEDREGWSGLAEEHNAWAGDAEGRASWRDSLENKDAVTDDPEKRRSWNGSLEDGDAGDDDAGERRDRSGSPEDGDAGTGDPGDDDETGRRSPFWKSFPDTPPEEFSLKSIRGRAVKGLLPFRREAVAPGPSERPPRPGADRGSESQDGDAPAPGGSGDPESSGSPASGLYSSYAIGSYGSYGASGSSGAPGDSGPVGSQDGDDPPGPDPGPDIAAQDTPDDWDPFPAGAAPPPLEGMPSVATGPHTARFSGSPPFLNIVAAALLCPVLAVWVATGALSVWCLVPLLVAPLAAFLLRSANPPALSSLVWLKGSLAGLAVLPAVWHPLPHPDFWHFSPAFLLAGTGAALGGALASAKPGLLRSPLAPAALLAALLPLAVSWMAGPAGPEPAPPAEILIFGGPARTHETSGPEASAEGGYGATGQPGTEGYGYGTTGQPGTEGYAYGSAGQPGTEGYGYGSAGQPGTEGYGYGSAGQPGTEGFGYGSYGQPGMEGYGYGSARQPGTEGYGSAGRPTGAFDRNPALGQDSPSRVPAVARDPAGTELAALLALVPLFLFLMSAGEAPRLPAMVFLAGLVALAMLKGAVDWGAGVFWTFAAFMVLPELLRGPKGALFGILLWAPAACEVAASYGWSSRGADVARIMALGWIAVLGLLSTFAKTRELRHLQAAAVRAVLLAHPLSLATMPGGAARTSGYGAGQAPPPPSRPHLSRAPAPMKATVMCRRPIGMPRAFTPPGLTCAVLASMSGGPWACRDGCVGAGDCVATCPAAALEMPRDGTPPVLIPERCNGCGLCALACPKSLVKLVPASWKAVVPCRGTPTMKAMDALCRAGCLGCGLCRKACPKGALAWTPPACATDPHPAAGHAAPPPVHRGPGPPRGPRGGAKPAVNQAICLDPEGGDCEFECLMSCPREVVRIRRT
jgi:ferredoxin